MNFLASYKNFVFGFVILLVLVSAIFLRERISNLLVLDGKNQFTAPDSVSTTPSASTTKNIVKPAPKMQVSVPPSKGSAIVESIPVYTGRDPEEVRPIPEEVQVFTEDQKQHVYNNLQTEGRAVKADPSFFYGWLQLGGLKKTIGDFEGARDAWIYAGILQPGNSVSFADLGDLYWRYLHQYPDAEKNLLISIRNKPSDVTTYITLADVYHYSYIEKHNQAPDVLLQGLAVNANDTTLMRHLAYIYELRNELDNALTWYQKIAVLNPDDQDVQAKINKLKEALHKN